MDIDALLAKLAEDRRRDYTHWAQTMLANPDVVPFRQATLFLLARLAGGTSFGLHRAAAVGMQGELAGGDIMLDDGVVEQGFEQRGAFSIGDAPGDDPAAENIDDDIE